MTWCCLIEFYKEQMKKKINFLGEVGKTHILPHAAATCSWIGWTFQSRSVVGSRKMRGEWGFVIVSGADEQLIHGGPDRLTWVKRKDVHREEGLEHVETEVLLVDFELELLKHVNIWNMPIKRSLQSGQKPTIMYFQKLPVSLPNDALVLMDHDAGMF